MRSVAGPRPVPPDWRFTEEDWAELEERRIAAAEARGRASGLPAKWQGLRWEELDAEESPARAKAIEAARRWAGDEGAAGLYLSGPVGIGKTRIAATAAVHRLRFAPVRYRPVTQLMMALSLDWKHPDRERALKSLEPPRGGAGRSTLLLDDIDKVRPTEFQIAPLYSAINAWVEGELPLLITSNKDLNGLGEFFPGHWGEAIGSRLAEYCQQFEIKGRDRRVNP